MAKLSRIYHRLFGSTAGTAEIGKFGSFAAGTPVTYSGATAEANVVTMASLSNWLAGWKAAVVGGNSPTIEDFNAYCYYLSRQIGYTMQAGVPEWDATTIYYIGSVVNVAGVLYRSITDNNVNNAVTNATYWLNQLATYVPETTFGGIGTTGIPRNTSGTAAGSGEVGYFMENFNGSGVFMTSNASYYNVAALTLPTGRWYVSANCYVVVGSTTSASASSKLIIKGNTTGVLGQTQLNTGAPSTGTNWTAGPMAYAGRIVNVVTADADKSVAVATNCFANGAQGYGYISALAMP